MISDDFTFLCVYHHMQHMALLLLQKVLLLHLAKRADPIIFRTSLNQKQHSDINLFAGLNTW